jgi:Nucleotidyl transferase AbiEii toxin, Type IV TA system
MLHYNTVNDLLKESLIKIMASNEFSAFRLVGGTALSLQLGHRISIDIDLFCDAEYGSISFEELEQFLKANFNA